MKLRERARGPHGTEADDKACAEAIDAAELIRTVMVRDPVGPALKRLREFRDRRLAHRLYGKQPEEPPTFDDLFLLISTARTFVEVAGFAIARLTRDLTREEDIKRPPDLQFRGSALAGVVDRAPPDEVARLRDE